MKASLSTFLIGCCLVISLGPAALVFGLCYSQARGRLRNGITTQLRTIADDKVKQLETCIRAYERDITALAHSPTILETIPHVDTRAASRNAGSFGSGGIDSKLGGYLAVHLKEMGYANLLLIAADGQVLLAAKSDDELGGNIEDARKRTRC